MKMMKPRLSAAPAGRVRTLTTGETARPRGRRWMDLRQRVFERDQFRCCACGAPGVGHQVDHIVPLEQGGAAWDIDNLQTLCDDCHKTKTAKQAAHQNGAF